MEINRNNYEEFFLDYWEKNLDKNGTRKLMLFLAQNKDLEEEFWSFENIKLVPEENMALETKASLKRSEIVDYKGINESNYQHFFVSYIENDLSAEEVKNTNEFISINPVLNNEFELYKKTVLKPELSLKFIDKESLKKQGVVNIDFRKVLYYSLSAAASVAVLLIAFFVLKTGSNEKSQIVRLLHEKKVDNYRNIVVPDKPVRKFRENNNDKNFVINKNYQNTERNLTRDDENYKVDAIAAIKPVKVGNDEFVMNGDIFTQPEYSENITDYIDYLKSNSDIRYIANKKHGNIDDNVPAGKFTFWDVAEAGVKGYNVLANKKVDFKKQTDKDGKLMYMAFGRNFGYSRSKR